MSVKIDNKGIKCPICSRQVSLETGESRKFFPFCSQRCKMVDLGKWLDNNYKIPVKDAAQEQP